MALCLLPVEGLIKLDILDMLEIGLTDTIGKRYVALKGIIDIKLCIESTSI